MGMACQHRGPIAPLTSPTVSTCPSRTAVGAVKEHQHHPESEEAQRKGQAQRDQGEETVREGVLSFWGVQPEPNVEVHAYGQDSTERNQAPPVTSGAPSVQSSSTRRKWDLSGDDRKSGLSGAARTVVVDCRPSADRNDAGSGE